MPKTVKRGPLKFFNIHSVEKFQKTEGRPFGVFRKIFDKNENFYSLIVPKNLNKRDPLGVSNIRSVLKYQAN